MMDVHTSGHAYQEELKQMIDYVRPKYFIPIHGEYFMRQAHAVLAEEKCRIPRSNVLLIQNGDVLLAERGKVSKSAETVDTKYILIDGLGEGQMGSQVQVDRTIMSENGALIILIHVSKKGKKLIRTPDVVSRGFTYMKESEEVTMEIAKIAGDAFRRIREKNPGADRKDVKRYVQQTIDKYTHNKLERRPLIIPLIIES
jgi:ribonuclease J